MASQNQYETIEGGVDSYAQAKRTSNRCKERIIFHDVVGTPQTHNTV